MKKKREKLGFHCLSTYRNELFSISIISIIIFHFCENLIKSTSLTGIKLLPFQVYLNIVSSIGVEIFVLLSGLGLYFSFRKNSEIRGFYFKRFLRILVPYGIFAGIAWFVIEIISKGNFWGYIYNFSLLSFWTNGNIMLWYIAFTLLMYLAFPLIFTIINSEHSGRNTIITLAVLYVVLFACENLSKSGFDNIEIALWRVPLFIIGTYFGKLAYEKQELNLWHYIFFIFCLLQKVFYVFLNMLLGAENASEPFAAIYNVMHKYSRAFSGLYSLGLVFLLVIIFRALNSNIIAKISLPISKVTLELYMTHVTLRNISNRLHLPSGEVWYFLIYLSASIIITVILNIVSNKIIHKITAKYQMSAKHYK